LRAAAQALRESPGAKDSAVKVDKTIVLVGLMGAGKTYVGKRLAEQLGLPFIDADTEIEAAAGCTIDEIFARYGEPEFRAGERRVMRRLLSSPPCVLASGGGAFVDPETRAFVKLHGISVWLRADIDVLASRVTRRGGRPLLKGGDTRAVLARLMAERYPVYAEADVIVDSAREPPEQTVERVMARLVALQGCTHAGAAA
jgi:shikimate kinase